jgi:hypothetical protein
MEVSVLLTGIFKSKMIPRVVGAVENRGYIIKEARNKEENAPKAHETWVEGSRSREDRTYAQSGGKCLGNTLLRTFSNL